MDSSPKITNDQDDNDNDSDSEYSDSVVTDKSLLHVPFRNAPNESKLEVTGI